MLHELNKEQNRHLMAKIDGHKHCIQKLMVAEWHYFTRNFGVLIIAKYFSRAFKTKLFFLIFYYKLLRCKDTYKTEQHNRSSKAFVEFNVVKTIKLKILALCKNKACSFLLAVEVWRQSLSTTGIFKRKYCAVRRRRKTSTLNLSKSNDQFYSSIAWRLRQN